MGFAAVFSTTHNLVKVHYGFCPVNFTCCFERFAWGYCLLLCCRLGCWLQGPPATINVGVCGLWVCGCAQGHTAVVLGYSVSPYRVYFYLFLIQTLQIMSTFHLPSILSESKAKDIWRRRCWFQSDQIQVILRSILCSVQMSWEELRCILRLRFWYGRFGKTSDDTVLLKSVIPMQRSATLLQSPSCDCESNGCWPHIWKLRDESNNENKKGFW